MAQAARLALRQRRDSRPAGAFSVVRFGTDRYEVGRIFSLLFSHRADRRRAQGQARVNRQQQNKNRLRGLEGIVF